MVDLRKLKHIVAVAHVQSYARAAQQLNITQPALSRSVQSVEDEFGVRIFNRGRRGAQLTNEGRRFVADAQRVLHEAGALERNVALAAGGRIGKVACGFGFTAADIFLSDLLTHLIYQRPEVQSQVVIQPVPALEALLVAGEIDFFVASELLMSRSHDRVVKSLFDVFLGFYVRPGHPLLQQRTVSHRDLERYPILTGGSQRPTSDALLTINEASWLHRTVNCDDYSLLRQIALQSDAVILTGRPRSGRSLQLGGLQFLEVRLPEPFPVSPVSAMTIKDRRLSPAAKFAFDHIVARATFLA